MCACVCAKFPKSSLSAGNPGATWEPGGTSRNGTPPKAPNTRTPADVLNTSTHKLTPRTYTYPITHIRAHLHLRSRLLVPGYTPRTTAHRGADVPGRGVSSQTQFFLGRCQNRQRGTYLLYVCVHLSVCIWHGLIALCTLFLLSISCLIPGTNHARNIYVCICIHYHNFSIWKCAYSHLCINMIFFTCKR